MRGGTLADRITVLHTATEIPASYLHYTSIKYTDTYIKKYFDILQSVLPSASELEIDISVTVGMTFNQSS